MPNSYSSIYIQSVFAVKYRKAVIDKKWKNDLYAVMGNLFKQNNCLPLAINGIEDHVHCFYKLGRTVSIAEVLKNVKGKSSKWINDSNLTPGKFVWQTGYGSFSYGQSDYNRIVEYVRNQEQHHKRTTFNEEYRNLLREFEIDFDDEYLFRDVE